MFLVNILSYLGKGAGGCKRTKCAFVQVCSIRTFKTMLTLCNICHLQELAQQRDRNHSCRHFCRDDKAFQFVRRSIFAPLLAFSPSRMPSLLPQHLLSLPPPATPTPLPEIDSSRPHTSDETGSYPPSPPAFQRFVTQQHLCDSAWHVRRPGKPAAAVLAEQLAISDPCS